MKVLSKITTIGVVWGIVLLLPFFIVYYFLRVPNFDFSIQLTAEPSPEKQFLLLPREAIDQFDNKLTELERIDPRLQRIVRYDVYFTNETTAEDAYNNAVLPARLICIIDKSSRQERVFQYEIKERIVENLKFPDPNLFRCEGGIGASLELPGRTLGPGETQSIPISFKGHFSTQATPSTYFYTYLIIFSIIIGALRILKEAIAIIRRNLKYFTE